MEIAITISRVIMGLCFVIIGLNFWANWFQMPQEDGPAKRFLEAMEESGYMHAVKTIEVSGGMMMLVGFKLPLALMLLGPVIANIFLFHSCLDRRGLPVATMLVVLEGFLLFMYRDSFAGIIGSIRTLAAQG